MDAIDYYSREELLYRNKCEREKVNAFQATLGIAFITFEDDQVASRSVGNRAHDDNFSEVGGVRRVLEVLKSLHCNV